MDTIESNYTSDKMKFEFGNAGFKMYRKSDEQARDILDEARSSGNLNLNGDNDKDPLRKQLVENIISLIATE